MYRDFGVNPVNLTKPVVEIDLEYGIVKNDPFYWVRAPIIADLHDWTPTMTPIVAHRAMAASHAARSW